MKIFCKKPLTSRTLQLISKSVLSVSFLVLTSCAIFDNKSESPDTIIKKASHQKIFYAPYDIVWRAAHQAIKYTIASENQDFGVIETDYVKAVDGWLPPDKTKPDYKSARYKLTFTFAKGRIEGRDSTRITIDKKIEVFTDFISDKQIVPSDGLEELTLFYRIEREILISMALKRASENPSNAAGN